MTSHAIGEARVEGGAERPDEGPRRLRNLDPHSVADGKANVGQAVDILDLGLKAGRIHAVTSADLVEIDGKIAHEAFDHLAP